MKLHKIKLSKGAAQLIEHEMVDGFLERDKEKDDVFYFSCNKLRSLIYVLERCSPYGGGKSEWRDAVLKEFKKKGFLRFENGNTYACPCKDAEAVRG